MVPGAGGRAHRASLPQSQWEGRGDPACQAGLAPANWIAPPEIVRLGPAPAPGPRPLTVRELTIIGVPMSWLATTALAAGMTVPGVAKTLTAVVLPLTGAVVVSQFVPVLQVLVPVVVLVHVWAKSPVEPRMETEMMPRLEPRNAMSGRVGFMTAVFGDFVGLISRSRQHREDDRPGTMPLFNQCVDCAEGGF